MTSRLSIFSSGRSRRRRASVAEVIRHAVTDSGLSRVFTRIKSVPHLNSSGAAHAVVGNGSTTHATGSQNPNRAEDQDSPILIIAPPTAPYPSRDMNIELGALGIIFPYPPPSNVGALSRTPPGADAISAWVEFFSQSEAEPRHGRPIAEPESVIGTVESTDEMATPFGAATSLMTLMDPDMSSQKSTPKEEEEGAVDIGSFEDEQNLQIIGDDVVLKYILDGMVPFEEPCLSRRINEESKVDSGCDLGPKVDADPQSTSALTSLPFEKALPELRHRKDPIYEEPPTISLITATPQGNTGQRHEYFAIPPTTSPPITLLTPCCSRYDPPYPTRYQRQSDAWANFTVSQAGPNPAYVQGSCDSIFLESEFAITRHASSSTLIPATQAVVHDSEPSQSRAGPDEHMTTPTVFNSLIRKLSVGLYSIFRFHRSAPEEIRPDEALYKKAKPERSLEVRSSNNEMRLYSLQSALDISLPIERS